MTTPIHPSPLPLRLRRRSRRVLQNAFANTQDGEAHIMPGTNKIMHVRLLINGSLIMLADDFSDKMGRPPQTPTALGGSPITLVLQLDEVRPFWDRAVAAGAIVTMPLADMFWGDRYGQLTDPFGHKWSVSQTLGAMTDDQMQQATEDAQAAKGTLKSEPAA